MSSITFLDIAKRAAADTEVGLIDETARAVPEVSGYNLLTGQQMNNLAQAKPITGTHYKTLVRTSLPSVGFRDANEGTASTKSGRENRLVEAFLMNPRWDIDKQLGDTDPQGPSALLAEEADAHMQAAFIQAGKQFYYGKNTTYGGKAKGFHGLIDAVGSAFTIDAGGSTATTGSSVWAVCWGRQGVRWVLGMNGKFDISDARIESVDDTDGNPYTAYVQELTAHIGLQVAGKQCVGRIKKLTEDSGCGLTPTRLRALLKTFTDVGKRPDAILMSQRSYDQYETALEGLSISPSEASKTGFRGVPFVVTNSISDVEALTL